MRKITAFIGLGSNLGEKQINILRSVALLNEADQIRTVKKSRLYKTKPFGVLDQPDFYNSVVKIKTSLSPKELLSVTSRIEKKMGRRRGKKWGPRVIDLDILLYGDSVVNTRDLKIPHPEMQKREFVLKPLHEIAPAFIHPTLGKKISKLLKELPKN